MAFKRFFKCMPSKYVDAFLNKGIFRMGTAHGYRAIEDPEIGDTGEGTLNLYAPLPNAVIAGTKNNPVNLKYGIIGETPTLELVNVGGTVILSDNVVENLYDYGDMYLFCFTDAYPTPEFLKKIGYDAAVEILDIRKFSNLLAERMVNTGLGTGKFELNKCQYLGRQYRQSQYNPLTYDSPGNPYFQKEQKHEYQEEMRIVFQPAAKTRNLRAEIMTCQDATALCTRIV